MSIMKPTHIDVNEYVGIPFKAGGRDIEGCDCYGLVALIYRDKLGINIPSYHDKYQTVEDRKAIVNLVDLGVSDWVEVESDDVRPYDVILMKIVSAPMHMGVVVAPNKIIHTGDGMDGSIIEDYTGYRLRRRVMGAYRYNECAR